MAEPHSFTVRRLVSDDWAVMRDLRLAALRDAPYAFGSTLERELGFTEQQWRLRTTTSVNFVAVANGQAVGIAAGIRDPDQPPGTWTLVSMWVDPQVRGQGVADQLVDAVLAMARGRGARRVNLWVTEANSRAEAFYRRIGFAPTGRRELVRPDEPDDWEHEMALDPRTLGP